MAVRVAPTMLRAFRASSYVGCACASDTHTPCPAARASLLRAADDAVIAFFFDTVPYTIIKLIKYPIL